MNLFLFFFFLVSKKTESIQHRKMLVRYVTLGKIALEELPTALYILSKSGSSILDQEEFEKQCGIGKYADLFGFSSWRIKPSRIMTHPNEEQIFFEKLKEKMVQKQKEVQEKKDMFEELK